jgi:2-desacetyl-2-hydroxyethyl bacteriochlorophyllide A dehydrogenase
MFNASIVIRTHNEEKHLGNLLRGIKEQDYTNYEVIIVDSGSTDKTLEIAQSFGAKIIRIESRDFTFGYSLNVGCEASRGEYLVFVSAHVIPTDTKWLSNLLEPFKDERVAMVYGRQMGAPQSKFSERMDFKRFFGKSPINSRVPLAYANNANSAVKKILWKERKFDEYLFGLEDIDWARHHAKKDHIIHYAPDAAIYHIHEERWGQVLNRYRREAIAAVRIGLSEPPQVKISILWMFTRIVFDLFSSFPNYTDARLNEIVRFRYYQWKGNKLGWRQGKDLDFEAARNSIFYPSENYSVVIKGAGKAELTETEVPEMKPGDILIKVEYVGVCRTDLEVYEGTLGYYRDGVAEYPIVPGHEFSGKIARVGSNNRFQERFKVDQRVVGECILSREISNRKEVGVINVNGAYSKFVVVPGDAVHKIPDNLDSKIAVLAEPLAVVLRALRRIEPRLNKKVRAAVIGAGQIGNFCTQVLALQDHSVDVFDRDEDRLRMLSGKTNATYTELKDLGTYDLIVEATGSKLVLEPVMKNTRVDATILLLGFPYGDMTYNFEDVVGKEKVIAGSVGADGIDFDKALEMLPQLDMKAFTEVVMPLENFKEAWEIHRESKHLKILLQP